MAQRIETSRSHVFSESDPFPRQSIVEGLKWSHIVVEVFPDHIESPGLNANYQCLLNQVR